MGKRKTLAKSRPYRTLYYNSESTSAGYVSQGHSKTEKGAVRGSVVRIFMKEHIKALIYEGEVLIYTVGANSLGLRVAFGRGS